LLDAVNLAKFFGGRKLFESVSFKASGGQRLALTGPNGSGKTTLLRILAGEEAPDDGAVHRRGDLDLGYLPQDLDVDSNKPLLAFVEDVADEIKQVGKELAKIEEAMARHEADDALLARYGHLQSRFEHLDGYALRARSERILVGLGFSEEQFDRPVQALSGGWRMRAALAGILLKEPDLILLDEPTNHLDIVSLQWLEEHIIQSQAAYIIVSHDIEFLNRVATDVLSIEGVGVVRTKGNYSAYLKARELRLEQARAAYENHQKKVAAEQAFVDRFRAKATKAKQVQSRIKRMEKAEAPPPPPAEAKALSFSLPSPARAGKVIATLEGVEAGYGEVSVYSNLDFKVERGEKIALIGPNGAGKSTLLKLLAGSMSPRGGKLTYGHNVTVSYFAQHQLEQLDPKLTALEEMRKLPGLRSETELRGMLGAFLFTGEEVDKKVAVLSGGEKTRLVLAKIMADPGNFFLLDEPTNHLDLAACETLKKALAEYDGSLCFISHDRDLINKAANKVIWVEHGNIKTYLGNYDYFLRKSQSEEAEKDAETAADKSSKASAPKISKRDERRLEAENRQKFRKATEELRKKVHDLEEKITKAEARVEELETMLADPAFYSDPAKAAAAAKERTELVKELEVLGQNWENAAVELEEVEAGFSGG